MTQEREIAAVPATDDAYGEAVSDEEFATWVQRSQDDTERVLAEWDGSVEFHMEHQADEPEPTFDGLASRDVLATGGFDWRLYYDYVFGRARRACEDAGLVIVESEPYKSTLILPSDGIVAWARQTFNL